MLLFNYFVVNVYMKNKKIIIISAIGIITLGIGLGFILLNSRIIPTPIKPILENNAFTLQNVKLNKRIISDTDGTLPNTQNVPGAFSLSEIDNFRRNTNENGSGNLMIKNQETTYEIQENSSWFNKTVLLMNKKEIWSKMLVFTTFDPIRSFFVINNTVVLAYDHFPSDNKREQDVVVNGQSMNEKYGLKTSFAAYKFDSKIVFFAQKDSKYYAVINEGFYELPNTIKEIIDPPCCEPSIYAVIADNNNIIFYSENNDGYWYQNEIHLQN